MASKRAIRRRNERIARLEKERQEALDMAANKLEGNVGRTSVADIILARTKLLHPAKPSIQVATPTPTKPAPGVGGAASPSHKPQPPAPQPVEANGQDSIISSTGTRNSSSRKRRKTVTTT